MTYNDFYKKYKNKYIDYDKSYGCQCWDLAQQYITECLKLPSSILSGCGLVSNMLKGEKNKQLLKYFEEVKTPKKGDLALWEYGHIAIYDYTGSISKKNYYFSQNPNACKLMQINRTGVHFFRVKTANEKKYIEINTPAGVWCRKGLGFSFEKYKVIPYKTKCELVAKNVGLANGYNWDKIIYNGIVLYLPNKWNKYL